MCIYREGLRHEFTPPDSVSRCGCLHWGTSKWHVPRHLPRGCHLDKGREGVPHGRFLCQVHLGATPHLTQSRGPAARVRLWCVGPGPPPWGPPNVARPRTPSSAAGHLIFAHGGLLGTQQCSPLPGPAGRVRGGPRFLCRYQRAGGRCQRPSPRLLERRPGRGHAVMIMPGEGEGQTQPQSHATFQRRRSGPSLHRGTRGAGIPPCPGDTVSSLWA